MQFANVGGLRVEAARELKAICPGCGSEVIAKCGKVKIRHWAHKGKRNCDQWWEPETRWHRDWKNKFPEEMRETRCVADSGEVHIADIKNPAGLVIEFQHSPITPEERRSRESYYGNMVWVVDGMRLKLDRQRFEKGSRLLRQHTQGVLSVLTIHESAECFPLQWLDCTVPMLFDFGENHGQNAIMPLLLPGKVEGASVVIAVSRSQFVDLAQSQPNIVDYRELLKEVSILLSNERARQRPKPSPPLLGFQQYLYRLDRSRRRF